VLLAVMLSRDSEPGAQSGVFRATLDNGLRVVIVEDDLAPVVTVESSYMVGADETPDGFPGMAHAQEHMAFRGCADLSADQTAAIFALLGGDGNAETQQNVTQYFSTVPAADLDVALRVDAACMRHIDDADAEWAEERGAIEQEVARDLSDPTYRFITRVNDDLFAGTPYAHDALGTKTSFDATTGDMLRRFHDAWYAPNNAVLVIVGHVDPARTMATIRTLYGDIPRKALPERPAVTLPPVRAEIFALESNLPYTLAFIGYRLPGTDSPDFAAARVLADVLASQRGSLYGLVPAGRALAADFELVETYPKASVGFSAAAIPAGADAVAMIATLRELVAGSVRTGVSADLVEAAKRLEVAHAQFDRNSIPGLAQAWSQAIAAEGRTSPDDDVAAIQRVTVDDVNRVARQFLVPTNAVAATLVPSRSPAPITAKGFGGGEQTTSAPTAAVDLPAWASTALDAIHVPSETPRWTDTTLPNGLRLIVRTETTNPTVTVLGRVRHEARLQAPRGKEGIDDVLDDLFSYGTTSLDRLAFQKALDDIGASETGGADFSLRVLQAHWSRGVELLADHELHPALLDEAFAVVKQQTIDYLKGRLESPGYKADRLLRVSLLPAADPALRDATPETVASLTIDDVRRYHATTFRPDLTTIVVIGDVTPEEARAVISQWFGGWTATGATPDLTLPHVPPNAPSSVVVPDPTAVQASVVLAETIDLTRFDRDYYALALGNHILGGGFYATRLYHDLRQTTGYVYTVDDRLTSTRSRSVYSVTYGCDPANVAKARDLIERDLRAMATSNVTTAELHQAKALLLRQLPLQESSEDDVAAGLIARADIGLPLDEPQQAAERYAALTADDVRTAFSHWIRPDAFVQVVRGPAAP
jgi:zinc protease